MTKKSIRKPKSGRKSSPSGKGNKARPQASRSSKVNKRSTGQPVSLLLRLRRWFGPRQQEVLAILLLVIAVLTLLGLIGMTTGSLIDAWTRFVQQALGLGVYPLAVALAALGAWLLLRSVNQAPSIQWKTVAGLQITFLAALALIHLVASGDDSLALAQAGHGGGHVGWAIAGLLQRAVGNLIAFLLLLAGLVVGLAITFDWSPVDLLAVGENLASRARGTGKGPPSTEARPAKAQSRSPRQRSLPAEQRAVAKSKPEEEAIVQPVPKPIAASLPQPAVARVGAKLEPETRARRRAVRLPPLDMLIADTDSNYGDADVRYRAQVIEETLASFGVPVEVVDINQGPVVTQFGLKPLFTEYRTPGGEIRQRKVRVSKISALTNDLALALAASPIRIEAPVPGRAIVGVEVPNSQVALVGLRSVIESPVYQKKRSRLKIALGRSVSGEPVTADLATMPHLLIAGATGSGKSICIRTIITCLAFNNRPDDLRLAMIDPKMVELTRFNGLPHLLGPVETDLEHIGGVLYWATQEMDIRYKKFVAVNARHLDDYNKKVPLEERLPRIVILIDELADLMLSAPDETERTVTRLAQMARATGMHLVIATQRPSVDVVTGLIKANFPARVSFAVTSQVDSRVILDQPGAETLLSRGDMLYMAPDSSKLVRVQGCFVSDQEIGRLLDYWNDQVPLELRDTEIPWDQTIASSEYDSLLEEAIALVRQVGTASASFLQRRMRIGYPRASRLIDQMDEMGILGPPETGGRPRKVLLEAEGSPIWKVPEQAPERQDSRPG
jgi:S-DNA-T family DNA segregation ATPase FtsK/SpoIIIE